LEYGYIGPPTITIDPPTSGPIKDFSIKDRGTYSELPANPVRLDGGTGTGALINAYLQPANT